MQKGAPAHDGTGRGRGSVDGVAGAVDDLVKPLCVGRVLGDPPVEGEGDGYRVESFFYRNDDRVKDTYYVPETDKLPAPLPALIRVGVKLENVVEVIWSEWMPHYARVRYRGEDEDISHSILIDPDGHKEARKQKRAFAVEQEMVLVSELAFTPDHAKRIISSAGPGNAVSAAREALKLADGAFRTEPKRDHAINLIRGALISEAGCERIARAMAIAGVQLRDKNARSQQKFLKGMLTTLLP